MNLLKKDLHFKELAKIDMIAFTSHLLVSVSLAIAGFGIFALLYGLLARKVIETILMIQKGVNIFRSTRHFNIDEIIHIIRFGIFNLGDNLLNQFNRSIDLLLISHFLNYESLGAYDIIKRFLMRPIEFVNPLVTNISFPLMAKLYNRPQQVSKIFQRQLLDLGTISCSIFLFCAVHSKTIVEVLLGTQWQPYSSHFSILSLYFFFYAIGNPIGSLILARGKPELGLRWNIIVGILVPCSVLLGQYWGLTGITISLVIMQLLLLPIFHQQLISKLLPPIKMLEYYTILKIPLIIGILVSLLPFLTIYLILQNSLIRLLTSGVIAIALFILFNFKWNTVFIRDLQAILGSTQNNKLSNILRK